MMLNLLRRKWEAGVSYPGRNLERKADCQGLGQIVVQSLARVE